MEEAGVLSSTTCSFRKFCIASEERCGFSEKLACWPICFLFAVQKRLPQDHRVSLVNKCVALVTLLCNKLLWYREDHFLKISHTIAGKTDSRCLKSNLLKTEKQQQKPPKPTPKAPQNPNPTQNLPANNKIMNVKVNFLVFYLA